MLNMAMDEENRLENAVQENNEAVKDILRCLQGFGEQGHRKFALFIEEVRDGKTHIKRL